MYVFVCVYVQPLLCSALFHGIGMNSINGGSQTPRGTVSLLNKQEINPCGLMWQFLGTIQSAKTALKNNVDA